MARQLIDWMCEYCGAEYPEEEAANGCYRAHIEVDKQREEELTKFHRLQFEYHCTKYTIQCRVCKHEFPHYEETGCMGPSSVRKDKVFKCPKCGEESILDAKEIEEMCSVD